MQLYNLSLFSGAPEGEQKPYETFEHRRRTRFVRPFRGSLSVETTHRAPSTSSESAGQAIKFIDLMLGQI